MHALHWRIEFLLLQMSYRKPVNWGCYTTEKEAFPSPVRNSRQLCDRIVQLLNVFSDPIEANM